VTCRTRVIVDVDRQPIKWNIAPDPGIFAPGVRRSNDGAYKHSADQGMPDVQALEVRRPRRFLPAAAAGSAPVRPHSPLEPPRDPGERLGRRQPRDRDRALGPVLARRPVRPRLRPGRFPRRPARRARPGHRRALHPAPRREGQGTAVPPAAPADQGHLLAGTRPTGDITDSLPQDAQRGDRRGHPRPARPDDLRNPAQPGPRHIRPGGELT
jgi:hypothetical protein